MDLHDIRENYQKSSLTRADLAENPLEQLEMWLNQAIHEGATEPTAMTLCTVDKHNQPDGRIVLLKNIDHGLCFFTNYESKKATDIAATGKVSAVFFWKELERQVRVQGTIEKLDAKASDKYYLSRPEGSQIGAWASEQSQPIDNHNALESKVTATKNRFENEALSRPEFWGGYRINPTRFEFWQGRPSRLHDRLVYELTRKSDWYIERLQP